MAGFKVWTTGDLVNASDFNSYLQEQVIGRFANASARDSAISSLVGFFSTLNCKGFFSHLKWSF